MLRYRVRHRIVAAILTLIGVAAVGGGVAWLVTRAHRGTGEPAPVARLHHHALEPVNLCQNCAQGYNPLGTPSDEGPNPGLAIDDQPNTYWRTQEYYDHKLAPKAGTGIYLNASPGGGTVARALRITDATPGFWVAIYARNSQPPLRWPDPGWVRLSPRTRVHTNTLIPLSGAQRYRYFLVWITGLGGHEQLAIDQLTLYR